MIEVKNLVKRYGDHVAVKNLSFTVEEGQIYGFLGPNGAGKSTTMNIITGYLASTEGEVLINGHNILEEPEEAKKCIGYLPELPPVYTDMTVLEYLKFVAELKKIPKDQRKKQILEVMNLVKITDMQNRLIKNLSKGYRQRVGLAQAVLGYPPIIILDEPTVGLDPKQIIEIRDLIRQLGQEHTVIFSSHILSEVQAICDKILIIAHGKLVAFDDADNLEQSLTGSAELRFTTDAAPDRVREILSGVDGLGEIRLESQPDGTVSGQCHAAGEDLRQVSRAIFFAFAGAGEALLELSLSRASLEDIFLELTEGEEPAPADNTEEEIA